MKTTLAVTVIGFILLYFVDAALKINIFGWEMLAHSAIRFFTGFILVGIGVFYAHKIKLMNAVLMILALVLADDIMDYYRKIDSFSFEDTLHGVYMLLWGAVMGYVLIKLVQDRINQE